MANKQLLRLDVCSVKKAATRVAANYFTSEEDLKGEREFNPNAPASASR